MNVRFIYYGRDLPSPLENPDEDLLDWDACIEEPLPRYNSGTLKNSGLKPRGF
jgi:hypothetical protein